MTGWRFTTYSKFSTIVISGSVDTGSEIVQRKVVRPYVQTLANNSTGCRYSKITLKSAFIWGWIEVRYSNICITTEKGTYTSQYSCKHVGIRVNLRRSKICALCEHDFGLSLLCFDSTRGLKIPSTMNLESRPRFAKVCFRQVALKEGREMNRSNISGLF